MLNLIYFIILIPKIIYAVDTGLSYEIKRFQQDIEAATPILEDAIAKMKSDYINNISTLSCSSTLASSDTYVFSEQASSDSSDNNTLDVTPISEIVSGWVCNSETYGSSSEAKFFELSSDQDLQYILQVTFDEDPVISPTLQGRTVTFVAYGLGPEHPYITSTSGTDSTPSNSTQMASISGFHCHLEEKNSGDDDKPGYIITNSSNDPIKLWNFVEGPFSNCKFSQ